MADNEVLTYLQMLSPDDFRPAPKPPTMLEVQELDQWSPLIRRTTADIGRAHHWPSQGWDDRQWQTYLRREHLRHWVALSTAYQRGCCPWTCHRAETSR